MVAVRLIFTPASAHRRVARPFFNKKGSNWTVTCIDRSLGKSIELNRSPTKLSILTSIVVLGVILLLEETSAELEIYMDGNNLYQKNKLQLDDQE
jgi:hypothetical protein